MAGRNFSEKALILLVEDSRSIQRELSRRIERDLGFHVISASSYSEGVELINEYKDDIFLSVLDLNLPDASNAEILDYANYHGIPSIVFTGTLTAEIRDTILKDVVIDYVVKDSRAVTNLLSKIGQLVRNRAITAMVVDDSRSFRNFMVQLMRKYMFTIHEAVDGKDAVQKLAENPDISLVITDYDMPEMDGLELTRYIRRQYSREDLAIIGVSTENDSHLSVWFIKNGANDFLHKPFLEEEFYLRVAQNVETMERIRKLRHLDAMKNKFLGIAAHDLRNPINGIKGFTELLLEDSESFSDDEREMLEMVRTASLQMKTMVNDLLDVAVIESGKLEFRRSTVDLEKLITERLAIQKILAREKGITIIPKLQPVEPTMIDGDRIAQVVDNLLTNAIKFSPQGSEVEISLQGSDSRIVVCVSDHGPGISEEEQKILFKSFQKASARPTGGETSTGLGLTIVKSIVEGHGGEVWVQSVLGEGSSFYISLPVKTR